MGRHSIRQPDGTSLRVLSPSLWFTRAQLRLGRRFTDAERRAAKKARARGVGPWEFVDGMTAASTDSTTPDRAGEPA